MTGRSFNLRLTRLVLSLRTTCETARETQDGSEGRTMETLSNHIPLQNLDLYFCSSCPPREVSLVGRKVTKIAQQGKHATMICWTEQAPEWVGGWVHISGQPQLTIVGNERDACDSGLRAVCCNLTHCSLSVTNNTYFQGIDTLVIQPNAHHAACWNARAHRTSNCFLSRANPCRTCHPSARVASPALTRYHPVRTAARLGACRIAEKQREALET